MTEVRIVTVSWNAATGSFDDSGLRHYMANREVLKSEQQFFVHGGSPYWSVYLETRVLQGTTSRALSEALGEVPERSRGSDAGVSKAGDGQMAKLLSGLMRRDECWEGG